MDFTKHDTLISELLPKLEAFQDEFKKTHEAYWQALSTHDSVPAKDEASTELSVRPSTKPQEPTWADTAIMDKDLPFSVTVNEYLVPESRAVNGERKGWDVVFKTSDGVEEYGKSVGYGPESASRTSDWMLVEKL